MFFVFMLFIISGSNKSQLSNSGSLSLSWSESVAQGLDELVEKMEKQDLDDAQEVISGEAKVEEKKGGFFSFLKRNKNEEKEPKDINSEKPEKNDKEAESEDTSEEIAEVSDENTPQETKEKKWIISKLFWKDDKKQDTIVSTGDDLIVIKEDTNLVKETSSEISLSDKENIRLYAPEILAPEVKLPGVNLETQIGKSYSVWVHSLKLNNKYFNTTLWYLMRGDTITQTTVENSYGCFEVLVDNSVHASNNGKTWYVCKKWLTEKSGDESSVNNAPKVVVQTPVSEESSVNRDAIYIELPQLGIWTLTALTNDAGSLSNSISLSSWDVIDQLDAEDESNCFTALVRETAIPASIWKVITVCQKTQ